MFLKNFALALLHRWYLVVLGLVLAGLGATMAWTNTDTRYEAQASILLLPPPNVTRDALPAGDGNPLLYLSDLNQARDVILNAVSSQAVREEFAQHFPGAEQNIVPDQLSSGPIIVIQTSAPTDTAALEAIDYLSGQLEEALTTVQTELGTVPDAQIGSLRLTATPVAEANDTGKVRTAIVLGGGITVATIFLVGFIDAIVVPWRRRTRTIDLGTDDQDDDPVASEEGSVASDPDEEPADLGTDDQSGVVAAESSPNPCQARLTIGRRRILTRRPPSGRGAG